MAFNSFSYFLFLPVVYLLFFIIGDRGRWLVLLLASIAFYAALRAPYLLATLGVVTVLTYAVGIRLADCSDPRLKKAILWSGVAGNILILAILKYLPFLAHSINAAYGTVLPIGNTLVSIGVSYFTLQAISYLSDIYLEIEEPERHFGYFALYMAFFPKLMQGPIERAGALLPQLKNPYAFDYDNMRTGMLLFTWGLFQKVVIADRLALYVNPIFDNVHQHAGIVFVIATYLYALQIYFDFSGYTDMALGTAQMFNIQLTRNFNKPYLARSIADFWRRWHISFSRWLLDYIFKPLQMHWRDWKTWGTILALLITFFISGLWHGTHWGFVVWGLLHGLYLATGVICSPLQKRIHSKLGLQKTRVLKVWQTLVTFNLVSFAWIFFRSNTVNDAWFIILNLFNTTSNLASIILSQKTHEFVVLLVSLMIYWGIETYEGLLRISGNKKVGYRWLCYTILITMVITCGCFEESQFIYFRF